MASLPPDGTDFLSLLEEALEERRREELGCADDEPLEPLNSDSLMVALPGGGFHMCRGPQCPHIVVTGTDKSLVCQLTGIAWGTEIIAEHDAAWTGRSTTSGDPDCLSGTPMGGWKPRRDAFAESQRAFEMASRITGEQAKYCVTDRDKEAKSSRALVKRGALCVDEVREEPACRKQRTARRASESREATEKLRIEAICVCDKLTTPIDPSTGTPLNATSVSSKALLPTIDPRLQNIGFVTTMGVRKYLAKVVQNEDRLDMCRVHDIMVAANEFVRQQRAAAKQPVESHEKSRRRQYDGETKHYCVNLILSLWKAICMTPYVVDGKRGSESFRAFVAGVLYLLKRGLTLDVLNMEIVPRIDSLADQLPTLRSADASQCARQLQSSSHRGLCTLHRAISSFADMTADDEDYQACKEQWIITGSVAAQLKRFVEVRNNRTRAVQL